MKYLNLQGFENFTSFSTKIHTFALSFVAIYFDYYRFMRISYYWLQDFIPLTQTPQEVGAKLTQIGLEVEHIYPYQSIRGNLEGVVIGEVLTCQKHPNADKLSLTTVDIGNSEVVPIVCGAPNVAQGQKVLVAKVGATIYPMQGEPIAIKKAKIRGEVSEGMICAEDELGLGTNHEGIMVLNTGLPNGTPATAYINTYNDTIFEIGLTPNRADAASHWGVARDLKAAFQLPIQLPKIDAFSIDNQDFIIDVEIENSQACPRYAGLTITGVKVQESPNWLQNRLKAIGLNPINNIVDITNYVLHELGQPLHAFDAHKIKGKKVVVKTLAEGTPFVTLDKQTRQLKATDLMICDTQEPMCIAGVFGGANSGITTETQAVFLESAYFNPTFIRKTSQAHGLKTDASFRFERGTNPDAVVLALKRAALLIKEIAGGQISSPVIDIYPQAIAPFEVAVSYANIQRLIGIKVEQSFIHQLLANLDIQIRQADAQGMQLSVPPYRVDVQREADIVEEIIRFYGFDNIPLQAHAQSSFLANFDTKDRHKTQYQIAQALASNGFFEIVTNSLTKPLYSQALAQVNVENDVWILNKLSEDLAVMRQSLVFSGLEVANYNINRRQKDLKLFEFGKTYHKDKPKEQAREQYTEKNHLAIFLTGKTPAETWQQKSREFAFQDIAQAIQLICQKLNIQITQTTPTQNADFQYGLTYWVGQKCVAEAGLLAKNILKVADIKQAVWYADINWDLVFDLYTPTMQYQEIPKLPEVRRDLSLIIDKNCSFQAIQQIALKKEKNLIKAMNVFDVYEGESLGENKKSYSISFILQDETQTLTDKVIDKTMEKLMQAFSQELEAVIRK